MGESKLISVQQARQRLGARGEAMTDKEIESMLQMLRLLCNKVIDSVIEKEGSN